MMSILSQLFSIIFYCGIFEPVHGGEVKDGPNTIDRRFLFQLMSTVQLPVAKSDDKHIFTHTGTCTSDVSLASEF